MKVLIIGANGQLGSDLVKVMDDQNLIALTHKDIEICEFAKTRNILTEKAPDIVINTAAYHKVDECEENVEKTFEVNTYAVRHLAQVCRDIGSTLVHMSTDYVFGGEKNEPYTEADSPNPINVYGVSKLAGEYFVKNICKKHFIIRTSGLFGVAGSSGKGGNFVETMIRLAKEGKSIKVVADQVLSPTYTKDLAANIRDLIQTDRYGLYHITSHGECSWYDFAKAIFELTRLEPEFSPTTTEEFGAKAKRPGYSVLVNHNLKALGLDNMSVWKEALENYLTGKGHS
jgi:dTDP-4-dehydrorhamnose reductase